MTNHADRGSATDCPGHFWQADLGHSSQAPKHWVLQPYPYGSKELLMAHLSEHVIAPAEAKAEELRRK